MKKSTLVLYSGYCSVIVSFICIVTLSAQVPSLNVYQSAANPDATEQHRILGKIESRTEVENVDLIRFTDRDLFLNGSPFVFELPDGNRVVIDQINIYAKGIEGVGLTGKVDDNRGSITLIIREENVTGLLSVDDRMYSIEPLGSGLHALAVIDRSGFPTECKPVLSEEGGEPERPNEGRTYSADEPAIVDVLVVYTHDASNEVGDIRGLIDLSVLLTNESFVNSNIPIALRLIDIAAVSYQETGGNLIDELVWMRDSASLGSLIEWYRPDLTVMLVATGSYCGRAFLNSHSGNALSVVRTSCSASNYTFAHEIGHNFGAHHDVETDINIHYEYGHGFRDFLGNWRTIMAYPPPINRLNYWSNPDVYFEGVPMGSEDRENNARLLRERADYVANFRHLVPLAIEITGPDSLRRGEEGKWIVNVNGGYPPYSSTWHKLYHKEDFTQRGNGRFIYEIGEQSFTLESEITDRFGYMTTASLTVFVPENPDRFIVHQNFPNPFNSGTTISYEIPVVSDVRISVYDIMGRKLIDLIDGVHEPGYHSTVWNGLNERGNTVASGLYIYRMIATASDEPDRGDSYISANRMFFLK
jgi:hypothetical protein